MSKTTDNSFDAWLDAVLRKVIDDQQYIDGDTSYMPVDALDKVKAAIKAKCQEREDQAVTAKLLAIKEHIESEYQQLRTIGRVGDDGYTKIYIPAEFRQTVYALIDAELKGEHSTLDT